MTRGWKKKKSKSTWKQRGRCNLMHYHTVAVNRNPLGGYEATCPVGDACMTMGPDRPTQRPSHRAHNQPKGPPRTNENCSGASCSLRKLKGWLNVLLCRRSRTALESRHSGGTSHAERVRPAVSATSEDSTNLWLKLLGKKLHLYWTCTNFFPHPCFLKYT